MRDIEIFGSFPVSIISYEGIATLFDALTLRYNHSMEDFDGSWVW